MRLVLVQLALLVFVGCQGERPEPTQTIDPTKRLDPLVSAALSACIQHYTAIHKAGLMEVSLARECHVSRFKKLLAERGPECLNRQISASLCGAKAVNAGKAGECDIEGHLVAHHCDGCRFCERRRIECDLCKSKTLMENYTGSQKLIAKRVVPAKGKIPRAIQRAVKACNAKADAIEAVGTPFLVKLANRHRQGNCTERRFKHTYEANGLRCVTAITAVDRCEARRFKRVKRIREKNPGATVGGCEKVRAARSRACPN